MPLSSPSFPAGGYAQFAPNIQAAGAWTGRFIDDSGQVTVHGSAVLTKGVGHLTWEALAYLETILGEGRARAAVLNQIAANTAAANDQVAANIAAVNAALGSMAVTFDNLTADIEQLKEQQSQMLQALGLAVIPAWQTAEEVERGDDMGFERPSAHALGLVIEYWAMNGDREDRIEDANVEPWMSVISITPPAGTLVRSGSIVKVLINFEE